MKSVSALCLLIIFCTADASILNILMLQVRATKRAVENTIQQVKRIRDDTQQDVNLSVMNNWLQQKKEYNNYANAVLDSIRKTVENAEAKGKDAQHCYDAAQNILRSIDYATHNSAQQCQECAKQSIKANLSSIDCLIETGYKLIKELDQIFPECIKKYPSIIDFFKLHSCIRNQLKTCKVAQKKLKTDANSAKATAISASKAIVKQAIDCLKYPYSIARNEVAEAKSTATECVANVV